MISDVAIWHQLECGSYDADIECWSTLASEYGGPILDVGAGLGRVSLMLAALGHSVTALEIDRSLLTALSSRAGGLQVETLCADARSFQTGRSFGLIIVPMLTIQLFGGSEGRSRFFKAASSQLSPGGCIALAIADLLDDEDGAAGAQSSDVDSCVINSISYSTRAVALRRRDGQIGIERRREVSAAGGPVETHAATDWIDILGPELLEAEAAAAGLTIAPRRQIPATPEYIGSAVICLNG